ncbi:MAG TPA: Xaa-Pro peptidase family protein [Tepidisphaeraceae bacterium]|nr:Xaa-Pro peptidase family protein [Tepidisphaeraceae bacterium]
MASRSAATRSAGILLAADAAMDSLPEQARPMDALRGQRVTDALSAAGLDAVVCALPTNVLLLSGYWPIVGTGVIVAGRERRILLVPKDEQSLAERGHADEVRTFEPGGSLTQMATAAESVRDPLADIATELGIERGRIGFEAGEWFEPASYAAMHLYAGAMHRVLQSALPSATIEPADEMLRSLRTVKTPAELDRISAACAICQTAFTRGAGEVRAGVSEVEAAARFRVPLASPLASRADGHVAFMSGINSASAYGAYARSTDKVMARGELVLVHCNSYADGYWTDVTRTFCLGPPDERRRRMYDAVFAARDAAFKAIRPGARGADVDRAARDVLAAAGFAAAFKHPTGHGVGFAAIDHNARPRVHPKSDDVLEAGMIFNVEPAIYLDGLDGMRHCDMVRVTADGALVLTPFSSSMDELVLG